MILYFQCVRIRTRGLAISIIHHSYVVQSGGQCHDCMSDGKASKQRNRIRREYVADYVLYSYHNAMYCIVGEIESEVQSEAESQNIEQMISLFRPQPSMPCLALHATHRHITLKGANPG